jgi:hypothetical protein
MLSHRAVPLQQSRDVAGGRKSETITPFFRRRR